ncbi:MAG TPA: DNA-directed RNA polymerase subunit omega [Phycisphaerales bacterium]|nr:DNA-directed RNA polymerase subunit omega [Phycisphaerales bacterium]
MIENLRSQEVLKKVGGRFKLTALVQKRITELVQGSRPLIDNPKGKTLLEIVTQEIVEDKITYEGAPGQAKAGQSQ